MPEEVEKVLDRLMEDEEFLYKFQRDPDDALAEYELDRRVQELLRRGLTPETPETAAPTVVVVVVVVTDFPHERDPIQISSNIRKRIKELEKR